MLTHAAQITIGKGPRQVANSVSDPSDFAVIPQGAVRRDQRRRKRKRLPHGTNERIRLVNGFVQPSRRHFGAVHIFPPTAHGRSQRVDVGRKNSLVQFRPIHLALQPPSSVHRTPTRVGARRCQTTRPRPLWIAHAARLPQGIQDNAGSTQSHCFIQLDLPSQIVLPLGRAPVDGPKPLRFKRCLQRSVELYEGIPLLHIHPIASQNQEFSPQTIGPALKADQGIHPLCRVLTCPCRAARATQQAARRGATCG